MWLFEKRGFVSVVAYDPKKDFTKDSKFKTFAKNKDSHLLVRARIKDDLNWLKTVVPSMVIETDAGADYAYRAVISRKQFKKALAEAVDGITYDSHFKEVARDNSPPVGGRYGAMMSVWSAFAKLQDISPWSGSSWTSYGSGTSKGSSYGGFGLAKGSDSGAKSTPKQSPVLANGAKDMEEFLAEYIASEGGISYKGGDGPRTGFKPGDRVVGYTGEGEVLSVEARKGGADMVEVQMDNPKRKAKFISNYLMPVDLPEIPVKDPEDDDGFDYDLEWAYDTLRALRDEGKPLADFPDDMLPLLDDHAFELLTRLQEAENLLDGGTLSLDALNDIYDEVLWESSDDKTRLEIWADMENVPAKYEQDAIALFNKQEVSTS